MKVKKAAITLLSSLLFFLSCVDPSTANASYDCQIIDGKVRWGAGDLVKGQIGKVVISKKEKVWKRDKYGQFVLLTTVNPSQKRVYNKVNQNGLYFNIGGGRYIKSSSNSKYISAPEQIKACFNNSLNEKLYNHILEQIQQFKTTIYVGDYTTDSRVVFDVLKQVLNEHPQLFYVDQGDIVFWSNGKLELKFLYSQSKTKHMKATLDKKVQTIITQARKKKTEFEKVKYIHDYVVNHTKYDYENYVNNTIPYLSYTSYGVLVNGIAVCEGYADAMNLLLNKVGIKSVKVTGMANGEGHAWNLVKVDGQYYYLDATWDDPVLSDNRNMLRYDYFLVTEAQLAKDHDWNKQSYPKATSNKYSYLQ